MNQPADNPSKPQQPAKRRGRRIAAWAALLLILGVIYSQITIFVVPPIGIMPEGRTVIMLRMGAGETRTAFIDSPESVCERNYGGPSLFCRGAVLAALGEHGTIIFTMPYVEWLYLRTTHGAYY